MMHLKQIKKLFTFYNLDLVDFALVTYIAEEYPKTLVKQYLQAKGL